PAGLENSPRVRTCRNLRNPYPDCALLARPADPSFGGRRVSLFSSAGSAIRRAFHFSSEQARLPAGHPHHWLVSRFLPAMPAFAAVFPKTSAGVLLWPPVPRT